MDTSNKIYPERGTAKRTSLGAVATFAGNLIRALEHILLVPLFLAAWGNAVYGEWLTLFSLAGYMSLSGMGMGNYIVNKMTQAFSMGNLKEYARVFKSALSLYLRLLIIGIALISLIAFILPISSWFNINITDESTVRITILILGAYMLFGILSGPINGLYDSVGEFARGKIIIIIRELLLLGLVALTLLLGGGFISVAFWYFVLLIAFLAFIFFDAKKRYTEIQFSDVKADWGLAKSFIIPGLIFLMIPFADMITLQGSVLIIGFALGSVAVATFGVHRTLSNFISRLTTAIQPSLIPEISAYEKRGNYEKIKTIYNIFLKISLFVSLSATAFLMFTGGKIIEIWTGGAINFHPVLWFLLLTTVPVTNLWRFNLIFPMATNKYERFSGVRLFFSAVGILLAIIFIGFLGVVGVALGVLIGEFILGIWFAPRESLAIIKESKSKFLGALLKILPMFLLQIAAAFILHQLITSFWLELLTTGVLVISIGMLYARFFWLDSDELNIVLGFIGRIKGKIRGN